MLKYNTTIDKNLYTLLGHKRKLLQAALQTTHYLQANISSIFWSKQSECSMGLWANLTCLFISFLVLLDLWNFLLHNDTGQPYIPASSGSQDNEPVSVPLVELVDLSCKWNNSIRISDKNMNEMEMYHIITYNVCALTDFIARQLQFIDYTLVEHRFPTT